MREKWPGEFEAMKHKDIQPLVDWLRKWVLQHHQVSANDVPRDLIEQHDWRITEGARKGELLPNAAIGTAFRALQLDGLIYPAQRIPAADHDKGAHRDVNLYKLRGRAVDRTQDVDEFNAMVGAVQLLVGGFKPGGAYQPPTKPPADLTAQGWVGYRRGWADLFKAIRKSLAMSVIDDTLAALGRDPIGGKQDE